MGVIHLRKEATLKQWEELYDIAANIKELKPWEYLSDIDIITLELPNNEPIYCSIMGQAGQCYGIAAYIGYDAISNFHTMLRTTDIPPEQMIRYQDDNVILCYFGDREELTSKELKLIKDLDLKFRGRNNWIYFHHFKRGYVPFMLDQEEVIKETEILRNLFMALRSYIEEGLEVDFEDGNTLMRIYSPEDELWLNFEAPIKVPSKQFIAPVLEDELLITKLRQMRQNKGDWEFDIAYLNTTINDKEYDRPVNGRICILADRKLGMIISQDMLTPLDDDIQAIFKTLINPIIEFGRPSKILVRDHYVYYIIKDLCERIKIKLEIKGRLTAIDSFVKEFSGFRR